MTHVFRAVWPIVDEAIPLSALCREAEKDLPMLVAQAKAILTRPGRFTVAPSVDVPGSGGIADMVLLYQAPAAPMPTRSYWRAAS